MAPKKSSKTSDSINAKLALTIKSGKVTLGYKSTLKTLRAGKAKLIIIAGNTPPLRKSELECTFRSLTTACWPSAPSTTSPATTALRSSFAHRFGELWRESLADTTCNRLSSALPAVSSSAALPWLSWTPSDKLCTLVEYFSATASGRMIDTY
ncbi:hypothetical protein KC345_g312 [Hortaea werneckii]|nr:hypothetical protein KC345_g312 [Hortaea werneckii]